MLNWEGSRVWGLVIKLHSARLIISWKVRNIRIKLLLLFLLLLLLLLLLLQSKCSHKKQVMINYLCVTRDSSFIVMELCKNSL